MKARRFALSAVVVGVCIWVIFSPRRGTQDSWSVPPPPMGQFRINVVDAASGAPVGGAIVAPVCLGGTPFVRQRYVTDEQGAVDVRYFARSTMVPARISAVGYRTTSLVAWTNDLVFALSRGDAR